MRREPLPVEELEAVADIEVGEALRRTRTYYGKSLDDVEKALRIRASQIDAIERGDLEALPGRVYAIGFVRSYAEYLDLDGGKVVQLFKSQYMNGHDNSALSFPAPASETKTPAIWIVAFSLIAASACILFWNDMKQSDRTIVEDIAALPEHIETHINQEIKPTIDQEQYREIVTAVEDTITASEPAVGIENMGTEEVPRSGVILQILGESWVEIKDSDGRVLVSTVLEDGDEYFVPNSPGLSMSLGNAANVEILVNGRALMPLGKDGDVRRNIPLNTEYLETLDFKEVEELPEGIEDMGAAPPSDDSQIIPPNPNR